MPPPSLNFAERLFRETYESENTPANMTSYCAQCFTPDVQRAEILDKSKRVIVAELALKLIGYYVLFDGAPGSCEVDEPAVELSRLYVEAKLHGSRLGHTMIQHALTLARTDGFKTMWLGVWEENARAIAFYKKWLFKPIGEHTFLLGADEQRDLLLAHWL